MTNAKKPNQSSMRLYSQSHHRLYLNASERLRFLKVAKTRPHHIRAFALTLFYSGCRLSEARELIRDSLQEAEQLLSIRSLKKRSAHHIREVPIPLVLVETLKQHATRSTQNTLWDIDRITGYRWIKDIMHEADITGPQACPKGLRHGYGINAVQSGVQLNMIQKWMGHASIKTTAIYTSAVGKEEQAIAERMWE